MKELRYLGCLAVIMAMATGTRSFGEDRPKQPDEFHNGIKVWKEATINCDLLVTGDLTVQGKLFVKGRDILGEIDALNHPVVPNPGQKLAFGSVTLQNDGPTSNPGNNLTFSPSKLFGVGGGNNELLMYDNNNTAKDKWGNPPLNPAPKKILAVWYDSSIAPPAGIMPMVMRQYNFPVLDKPDFDPVFVIAFKGSTERMQYLRTGPRIVINVLYEPK